MHFEVEFKLVRGCENPTGPFQMKPSEHLIQVCDEEAKKAGETCS